MVTDDTILEEALGVKGGLVNASQIKLLLHNRIKDMLEKECIITLHTRLADRGGCVRGDKGLMLPR